VAQVCNPHTQEAEAGESGAQGQLRSETLPQEKQTSELNTPVFEFHVTLKLLILQMGLISDYYN
jgi:hypothetical protein